jgi:hypothetical protein
MRFLEVYSYEILCVKPNTLAKDLDLVWECTIDGYPKQYMIRVTSVYSGEMICIKPNALAKDLELVMECKTNGYPKQCMMRVS